MPVKLGRPPSKNPKGKAIVVRLTPDELAELHAKAADTGQTASDYIRTTALKGA